MTGLEPALLSELDPKSSASASSATSPGYPCCQAIELCGRLARRPMATVRSGAAPVRARYPNAWRLASPAPDRRVPVCPWIRRHARGRMRGGPQRHARRAEQTQTVYSFRWRLRAGKWECRPILSRVSFTRRVGRGVAGADGRWNVDPLNPRVRRAAAPLRSPARGERGWRGEDARPAWRGRHGEVGWGTNKPRRTNPNKPRRSTVSAGDFGRGNGNAVPSCPA